MDCFILLSSTYRLTCLPFTSVVKVASEWQARQSLSLGFCSARAAQAQRIKDKASVWARMFLDVFTPLRRRLGALTRSDWNRRVKRRRSRRSGCPTADGQGDSRVN